MCAAVITVVFVSVAHPEDDEVVRIDAADRNSYLIQVHRVDWEL